MNERLPSVCLVMFWVMGLFVTYQLDEFIVAFPPAIVSHTRVVPTARWPQPPGTPAGGQSSPPEIPPWKRSYGMVKDLMSLSEPPATPAHGANSLVQLLTQRLMAPPLLLWKKRRLDPVPTGSMRE